MAVSVRLRGLAPFSLLLEGADREGGAGGGGMSVRCTRGLLGADCAPEKWVLVGRGTLRAWCRRADLGGPDKTSAGVCWGMYDSETVCPCSSSRSLPFPFPYYRAVRL